MLFCTFVLQEIELLTFIEILQSYHLTALQWIAICFAVFLLGLSKSGIKGIGIIIVIILAFVFGEKASTGILLPMLIAADIFAVVYYNRHTQWVYIKKLLPWMVVGVLVGVWIGNDVSEVVFQRIMIGNLAGPISNIYFLATRLPKNEFIGTAAWLFFIINLFKLPFHFFVWHTVTTETLILNTTLIPVVILGFFIGASIVKLISNLNYRRFILIVTALGGILMLFG